MGRALRVGIIGASARGGWAKDSHVPAVRALAGLELAAVAGSSQQSADAAAAAFGVPLAFGDPLALCRSPAVDVVTVAIKVPDHRPLVLAAVAAGKHVYCEWPLGRDLAEADALAAAAHSAGVRTAIGLQLRGNPAVVRARQLIAAGRVGRIVSVRAFSSTAAFGPTVPESMWYAERPDSGANLLTIQAAHTLDLAIAVAGPLADLSARTSVQYPHLTVGDAGEKQDRQLPDHVALVGRLADGPPLVFEVVGGRPPTDTPARLEVTGTDGTLALTGGAPRGVQSGTLRLSVDGRDEPVDSGELADLPDAAVGVGGVYVAFRDGIAHGSPTVAGFDHAARLTRLLADLIISARTGNRVAAAGWPGLV